VPNGSSRVVSWGVDRKESRRRLEDLIRPAQLGRSDERRLTMNFSELNRLLLELVDLDVWAEHAATLMQRADLDGVPPWPYFVNEWKVWASPHERGSGRTPRCSAGPPGRARIASSLG
jgi:hypothetical protein